MINNRQGGRRRGRGGGGGGRQQSGPGPGNRQENRSRGNAAQLLEKYKSMARDAQMSGDRVQTEYYLQYADHYYRVLNENRARFEEQRPQRGEYYEEDEEQDEGMSADGRDEGDERSYRDERPSRDERPTRQDRPYRDDRDSRGDREERPYRSEAQGQRDGQREESEERRPRPDREARNGEPGRGRPRRDRFEASEGDERIALEVLPPAISAVPAAGSDDEQPAKAPRRRARRPRDEDGEIAPAA
ncbi:MAG TPA: DUF4167 domain-containing protein [Allosphingosinicella sp.]